MTLAEWAERWPYRVRQHEGGAMWTPDSDFGQERRDHRRLAWQLSDYLVSSVSGGTIWFTRRRQGEIG